MEKLNKLIQELINVLKENKVEVTGNCLFENAVKIYISNNINESINGKKELKEEKLNNEKEPDSNAPTDKQIKFLKRNKISVEGKTKQECTQIIKEIIEKEGRGDDRTKGKWSK